MKIRAIVIALFVALLAVPASAVAANSGYDGGFFLSSDDENFLLKLTGRVQSKFYFEHDNLNPDTLSFSIRRAQLNVFSSFHDIVSMGFTLKHAVTAVGTQNFDRVNVGGAFASVNIIPQLVVTVGMVGLPLDMMSEASSAWYLLPEAPVTNSQDDGITNLTPLRPSFGVPDGLGLNLSGGYWKWFYSLSVVNGAESNYDLNTNSKKMSFGFRTGINILDPVPGSMTDFACSETPKLTVNLGTMYQGSRIDPNTNADIDYLWTSTLGVGLRWGGFAFTTEGYYRRSKYASIGTARWLRDKLTDIGYYAAAGYYIIPKKFEIAAQAGQIIRQGPDNNVWQFGGGVNYYIFDNNLKLQAAYTMTEDYDGIQGPNNLKIHVGTLMLSALF